MADVCEEFSFDYFDSILSNNFSFYVESCSLEKNLLWKNFIYFFYS